MWGQFFSVGLLIGFCSILFYTPCLFCRGIYRLKLGESLPKKAKLYACIPILNLVKGEKEYTGKFSKSGYSVVLLLLATGIRLLAIFQFTSNFYVQLVTIILFSVCIFLAYAANAIIVFRVLHDADTMSLIGKVVLSVFYPLGQYYIGIHLPTVMKNSRKEERTFL